MQYGSSSKTHIDILEERGHNNVAEIDQGFQLLGRLQLVRFVPGSGDEAHESFSGSGREGLLCQLRVQPDSLQGLLHIFPVFKTESLMSSIECVLDSLQKQCHHNLHN